MEVIRSRQHEALAGSGAAVTIGNFDGVHRGHQQLLARTVGLARAHSVASIVLCFDPHPARYFRPDYDLRLISSEQEKFALLEEAGIDKVVVDRFDKGYAEMRPKTFVDCVLMERLQAQHVVVGRTFVFGYRRAGDVDLLRELGRERGYATHAIEPVVHGDAPVSSTRVRRAVTGGDVAEANAMLGRRFRLAGRVISGDGRGRTIGVPTANLATEAELVPARGVYAGFAELMGHRAWHPAVINIGVAPTVRDAHDTRIEAHLLDFDGDLLASSIVLHFGDRLREEKRYGSIDALVAAIRRDIACARERLGTGRQ